MTSRTSDKNDMEQIILYLNENQKFVGQVQKSAIANDTIDITILNNHDADQPDPLRLPEIIIVIFVLLLWCGSIFCFIRHSELLRIRHRDLPFRSSVKPPMNLNHITVVHRTSDMVIHSKPRRASTAGVTPTLSEHRAKKYRKIESPTPSTKQSSPKDFKEHQLSSSNPNTTTITTKPSYRGEQLLDPRMISHDVRRSLLDLHFKSMENLSAVRHSISYSTTDVSRRKQGGTQHTTANEREVQESPV